MKQNEIDFLSHSNYIEEECSQEAFDSAVEAWKYIKKEKKITIEKILRCHKKLLKKIKPRIAGKFRNCDVWIGGHRKFFISEALIKDDLEKLVNMFNNFYPEYKEEKEAYCKHCHVQFEGLHPFEDGNGRIGRILYNWQRISLGLPIHVIREDDKYEYYKWFK